MFKGSILSEVHIAPTRTKKQADHLSILSNI